MHSVGGWCCLRLKTDHFLLSSQANQCNFNRFRVLPWFVFVLSLSFGFDSSFCRLPAVSECTFTYSQPFYLLPTMAVAIYRFDTIQANAYLHLCMNECTAHAKCTRFSIRVLREGRAAIVSFESANNENKMVIYICLYSTWIGFRSFEILHLNVKTISTHTETRWSTDKHRSMQPFKFRPSSNRQNCFRFIRLFFSRNGTYFRAIDMNWVEHLHFVRFTCSLWLFKQCENLPNISTRLILYERQRNIRIWSTIFFVFA